MEKLKTMADVLESQVKLVDGLEIVKIRELNSWYKVKFKFNEFIGEEIKLDKSCTPGSEVKFCRFIIDSFITSYYINNQMWNEAKLWNEHKAWDNILEKEFLITVLSKSTNLCDIFKCTAKNIEEAREKAKNFIKNNPDFYGDEIIQVHSNTIKEML